MATQTPEKDGEIFDLTDLIEKGESRAQEPGKASQDGGGPDLGGSPSDQSEEDVDSLLDQMVGVSEQAGSGKPVESVGQERPGVVDPNEKLDMSGMGKADDLFASLGSLGGPPQRREAPAEQPRTAPIAEVDDLLAAAVAPPDQKKKPARKPAEEPAEPPSAEPAETASSLPEPPGVAKMSAALDDFISAVDGAINVAETPDAGEPESAPAEAPPEAPAPAPAPVDDFDLDELLAHADAAASAAQQSQAQAPAAPPAPPTPPAAPTSPAAPAPPLSSDDLDALLAQAQDTPQPQATAPAPPPSAPAAPKAPLSSDDLDALLAQAQDAPQPQAPAPAPPPSAPAAPKTPLSSDDLDALLAEGQVAPEPEAPAPAPPPSAPTAPKTPVSTEDLDAFMAQAAATPQPGADTSAPAPDQPPLDEAPSGTAEEDVPQAEGREPLDAPSGRRPQQPSGMDQPIDMTELLTRLESCETALSVAQDRILELEAQHGQPPLALDDVMDAILHEDSPVFTRMEAVLEEFGIQIADRIDEVHQTLESQMQSLEARIAEKGAQAEGGAAPDEMKEALHNAGERIEALEALLEENGPLMTGLAEMIAAAVEQDREASEGAVRNLETELEALKQTVSDLEPRMKKTLEKAAAAAAAKILREEIAAMLQEG
ncbi:MAG: hypothetical protein LBR22_02350 [Desulfovibrio sp.]|jgi:hypothetical protein|nr:hypothetical protein [Desulfovibrio sp.]